MNPQLPALQVVLPLMAAAIVVLLRWVRFARFVAIGVAWACLAISLTLLSTVLSGEPISYHMGGWAPPLGIEFRIDVANAWLLVIVSAMAAVIFPFRAQGIGMDLPKVHGHHYWAALLLCLAGLFGMSITGDLFNVFVFVEVTSLASYALVSQGSNRRALKAAYAYLVMGTIGGTFILIGIGLLYQMTGTLNMADIAERLPLVKSQRTTVVAFAFLMVGASIKLAVFPLHQWLPNAYAFAPAKVSAFLASTATKVSFYVLLRVVYTVFGASFVFSVIHFHWLLLPLSVAAMFVGSLAAIYQRNIKRLLAYSSIAQIGYMTLGLSTNTLEGLTGGLVHLFNHALLKGGLFLVVACVVLRLSARVDDWRGLGRHMPFTAAAFVVGGLGLIGVPGTVGFVSKWYLVLGGLQMGAWWVVALILLSSLLAVAYVWRVIEVMYLQAPPPDRAIKEAPLSMLLPTWILLGASIWFGLQTDMTVGVAKAAAQQLMGVP